MAKTSRRKSFGAHEEKSEDEHVFRDDYLEAKCPKLFDLLSRQVFEGADVKPVTLSFFAQNENLTGCLNWDQEGLILFQPIKGAEDVFEQLEAELESKKPHWRKKKGGRYSGK